MPKDTHAAIAPADLTPAELERLAGRLFCCGGPPEKIDPALLAKLTGR